MSDGWSFIIAFGLVIFLTIKVHRCMEPTAEEKARVKECTQICGDKGYILSYVSHTDNSCVCNTKYKSFK